MGSIDTPQFLRDKIKSKISPDTQDSNTIDTPDFLKKKENSANGNNLNNGIPDTSQSKLPSQSQLPKEVDQKLVDKIFPTKASNFQSENTEILTPLTKEQELESAVNEVVSKKNIQKKSVDDYNLRFGTNLNADDILNDADKSAVFLQQLKEGRAKNFVDQQEAIKKQAESQAEHPNANYDFGIENTFDQNSYSNKSLPQVKQLEAHVIDKTIDEGREKGLDKKQVLNGLFKRLDPKGYEQREAAIKARTELGITSFLSGTPFRGDTQEDIELLNTQKAPIEFAYNEGLRRMANDRIVIGTATNDNALIEDGKSLMSGVKTDDEIYKQYPSLNKSRVAEEIGQEIAGKTGQLEGTGAETLGDLGTKFFGLSARDIKDSEAFKKYYNNPSTRDAAMEVLANPDLVPDASFLKGIGYNVIKPFKELWLSGGDITGLRDRMDRLSDATKEQLFPEQAQGLKTYVSKVRGAVNTTAYLSGMMALQVPAVNVGEVVGLGAKGAERLGSAMSFGIPSFDANLKDADNFISNDAGKAAYATLGAMINTAGGEFLELGKISKFKELQSPLLELSNKITDKNITEKAVSELLDKAKNPYINALEKYGVNVTKGAATMSYFTFANGVNKMLFGGNESSEDLLQNTGTAFLDGVLGMSVLGAFGAHADLQREKNTSYKQNIYHIANNPDATKDVIETAYKNGTYDTPAYNEKIQIVNTAAAAKNVLDVAQSNHNVQLDEGQKSVYVANRTAEGVIQKQLESPVLTEEQKIRYENQLQRLQTQREDILKGLKFSDNLEPLNKIFEAQKKYDKAYEDFNNGTVDSDKEVLKAKDDLLKAQQEYDKSKEPENKPINEQVKEPSGVSGEVVKDTEIIPTLEKVKKIIPEERLTAAQDIITKVNNAENINEKDIEKAQDELYTALDAAPEAAHLIEPLILKLQDYEFTTKTETRTVDEETATQVARPVIERKAVSKNLDQWEGNRATITTPDGRQVNGLLKSENGKYSLFNENGDKIASIGEKAITDRAITLPSKEQVPSPIEVDENGDVKSITLQLNNVNMEHGGTDAGNIIKINFRDKEKALDYAIALRAEEIGEIPQPEFDTVYDKVQKEIQVEVPKFKTDIDKAKELVNSGVVKGFTAPILKEAAKKNETEFKQHLKDIAEQSQDQRSEKTTIETYGQPLVDIANKLFPKEDISSQSKIESNESKSNKDNGENAGQESSKGSENEKETVQENVKPPAPPQGKEKTLVGEGEESDGRRFTKQMLRSEELTPESREAIRKTLEYAEQTNDMSAKEAEDILKKIGPDAAFNIVTDRNNNLNGGTRTTLAQAVIKNYNELAKISSTEAEKNYYLDKTISTATFVTEKLATDAGQSIQAFSMWQRLSPEAQLRAAIKDIKVQGDSKKQKQQKSVDKVGNKLKKVNEDVANEITTPEKVKKAAEKLESKLSKKGKDKIEKAKAARENLIKKYKSDKGKNLYSGVGLTNEGIEFAGNLIKTYIDEGIGKLEILTDKVLQHLKDVSGKVPDENVTRHVNEIAQTYLQKAGDIKIAKGLKELESEIGKIVKEHYTVPEAAKKSLTDKFIDNLGLDKPEAEQLSKEIQTEFDNIATRKKQNILDSEIRRLNNIKNGLKGAKSADRKQIQDEIIKYSNLGAFDNGKLIDVIGEKLGLGELTREEAAKIMELSGKIQNAPEGSPKRNATEELLKYRANLKGNDWGEIAQGVWYANVLSGYATHLRNIVSTFYNTMAFFTTEAVSNPKAVPYLMLGLKEGLYRGLVEAEHTVKTGQTPIHISKVEVPDVLERIRFKGGLLNPANWLKYVGRLMKAEDVVLFQGLKEMRATQLAYREANNTLSKDRTSKQVRDKVNELLLNTKERLSEAEEQVKEEGLKGVEAERRTYELMESSRPIQMTDAAYGFAAKGTFNHDTEGSLGAISDAVSGFLDNSLQIGGAKPLRFLVPFTRIITNVANNTLDFSPVGLVRGAAGKRGLFASKVSGKRVEMTPEERRQTIIKASLGIAAMGTAYALSKNGIIQISGAGPSDIKKKIQLIEQGWQPYSIKIGDTYWSYKLTPLVFGLGIVGSIRDHEEYDKDADEQSLTDRVALTAWDGVKNIGDMTWVSSAAPLMGALADNNPATATKVMGNIIKNTGKSFILPNAYTQTAQKIEQVFSIPQKEAKDFGSLLIKDIPIARNYLNDKINALGDPVVKDVDLLKSSETKDPVWKFLLDKKGWVAPVNKNTVIVYDKNTKQDRPVTDDEYYEFAKTRGHKIKSEIQSIITRGTVYTTENKDGKTVVTTNEEISTGSIPLEKLTPSQLNDVLTPIKTKATKETKKELFSNDENE